MPVRAKPSETDPVLARLDDIPALLGVLVKRDRNGADVIGGLSAARLRPGRRVQKKGAPVSPQPKQDTKAVEPGSVDELTRLMAMHMRYSGAPQTTLIHDLSRLGLQPARIAELLGTTPNNVSQRKRDKRPDWPPRRDL
jgi:hypothetical protein